MCNYCLQQLHMIPRHTKTSRRRCLSANANWAARLCLTSKRPLCCTQSWTTSANQQPVIIGLPHLPHFGRRRQVLSTPDRPLSLFSCLYRTRRRSAYLGQIFEVQSLEPSSRPDGSTLFGRYRNFPKTRCSVDRGKTVTYANNQFDPYAVSTQYRRVTNRYTDLRR